MTMIPNSLIQKARDFAYSQAEKHEAPSPNNFDYINSVDQRLANELHASKDIVLIATTLSDCMLGPAFKVGDLSQHINMAIEEAGCLNSRYLQK